MPKIMPAQSVKAKWWALRTSAWEVDKTTFVWSNRGDCITCDQLATFNSQRPKKGAGRYVPLLSRHKPMSRKCFLHGWFSMGISLIFPVGCYPHSTSVFIMVVNIFWHYLIFGYKVKSRPKLGMSSSGEWSFSTIICQIVWLYGSFCAWFKVVVDFCGLWS